MIELLYPTSDRELSISTPVQREFIMNEKNGAHKKEEKRYSWLFERYAYNWGKNHVSDPNEVVLSAPGFIKFSWKADVASHIEICYADGNNYPGNPKPCETDYVYTCDGITTASMCNFMINTRYAWKVVADDHSQESETRYFTIKDEYPRMLYVQGTANVRDMGGAVTYDGRRLRQGRIYRGGELESGVELQYLISERGRRTLHDVLKIKSELDLRYEAQGVCTKSVIGDDIIFTIVPAGSYQPFFEIEKYKDGAESARKIFEFLADENHYPIYMHCTAGADRTGTVSYLIELLCGVKAEYSMLNYNITSLSLFDLRQRYGKMLFCDCLFTADELQLDDVAMSELASKRVEKFLVEKCGVRYESIEKIRRIMLE